MTAKDFRAICWAKPGWGSVLTTNEFSEIGCAVVDNRQRIHRALLLLEMIEDDDGTMLRPVSHWLFALDAASKEMGTRL